MNPKGFFFIPYITYILYSRTQERDYIGSTAEVLEQRIRRHNSNHAGFTGRTSDWRLVYKEEFPDKVSALRREKDSKAWKRGKRIEMVVSSIVKKKTLIGGEDSLD